MKKRTISFVIFFMVLSSISLYIFNYIVTEQGIRKYKSILFSNNVKVEVNGDLLEFDMEPIIINNRTLVPFREILEVLDAQAKWDGSTGTITAIKGNMTITLQVNSEVAFINMEKTELDVSAVIVEGKTLVPVRFISEALRCKVDWDNETRTVVINKLSDDNNKDKEFVFRGITIGDSKDKVIKTLGEPMRQDLSKYGFKWYIYNEDYSKYIQVGIDDNKVVGIYTNASNWKSKKGIMVGTTRNEIRSNYSEPLSSIKKGNTIYNLENSKANTYLINNYYITLFYDIYNNDAVTAVLLVEKEIEEGFDSFFGRASKELKESYERQIFDLTNAIRSRFNKTPYIWDDSVSKVARRHSQDMADRNYFSHNNPEEKTPFDRMKENNLDFIMAGENIAAGQPSAIFAHECWMNSKGHRKNILGDFKKLGVGLYFGGTYHIYYTQNFFTPSK
ncbi:CAP-associated domain-containing protein [Maledivibacter halophilus]|uniref:Copper amine oxidase N-terminal domain-containing protein n=1 Tax=Maledivibacter halophilus TaxID=36842 RepID=A0A1T5LJ09_9FIRM|nr:CAP-associated domain-containing protein [Maledivibacter halophilus]SKC75996.1 Copper amine oxidase N-terminal domain-containing protein [Maledivibacter halophilus]